MDEGSRSIDWRWRFVEEDAWTRGEGRTDSISERKDSVEEVTLSLWDTGRRSAYRVVVARQTDLSLPCCQLGR